MDLKSKTKDELRSMLERLASPDCPLVKCSCKPNVVDKLKYEIRQEIIRKEKVGNNG